MSSLQNALLRVTRMARNVESMQQKNRPTVSIDQRSKAPKQDARKRESLPKDELDALRPQLRGYQKKRHQKFLQPLGMPELKIYDSNLPKYDETRANFNLAAKTSTRPSDIFVSFINSRADFYQMVDLLVQLTPPYLKDEATINDPHQLTRVLMDQDHLYRRKKYEVPKFHFHEVPPMPSPLTKESFTEYIYYLTHVNMPYKNSSSLTSGIIPEILLHTHLLENDEFKDYRTVDSFNHLIHYFGYKKKQFSFARELLLVMTKDGHSPTIDTMNELLKICRIHAKRRSLVSTHKVVISYLKLIEHKQMEVNLTTWARVYECISNIFLRESFINRITSINLPILEHMCLKILDDFALTTTKTNELTNFIEKNLRRTEWRKDPRYTGKVLSFMIKNSSCNEDLGAVWKALKQYSIDGLAVENIISSIVANVKLQSKAFLALQAYVSLEKYVDSSTPQILTRLIQLVSQDTIETKTALFIVRSLIHQDAVQVLGLPVELDEPKLFKKLEVQEKKALDTVKNYTFPREIPRGNILEHYRIIKRLTLYCLTDFEAKTILSSVSEKPEVMLWDMLDDKEKKEWKEFKNNLRSQSEFWLNSEQKATTLGLQATKPFAQEEYVEAYRKINAVRSSISRDVNLIHRLRLGFETDVQRELRERGILSSPTK